jgi:hypothetical protein
MSILPAFYGLPPRRAPRLRQRCKPLKAAMLDWLVGSCDIFGLPCQNWMLVVSGALLMYVAILAVTRMVETIPR